MTALYESMGLDQTVRVSANGTVKRGVKVAVKAINRASIEDRIVAAPRRVVHTRRFAPGGIPAGVDQTTTAPHDCENHLDGGIFEQTPQPRIELRPLA